MLNRKTRVKNYVRKNRAKILAFVLTIVMVAAAVTVFAVANIPKEVTILDGSKTLSVTTNETNPEKILADNGFVLGKNDVLDASQFDKENAVLIIKREMTVNFVTGEKNEKVTLAARTAEDVLEHLGLTLGDKDVVIPSRITVIKDGDTVTLYRAGKAKLVVDGRTIELETSNTTVAGFLKQNNITLGKDDEVAPSLDSVVKNGETVSVTRVTYNTETLTEKIKFKTVEKDDATLVKGKTEVKTEGKDGQAKVTYKVKFENGKETSREKVKSETITAAVDKVVHKGTYESGTISASAEAKLKYSKKYTGIASAYTAAPGSMTASGMTVAVGRVGVNPNIIPYGTKLYITGYGYAVAADTGPGVVTMGRFVDLFMNSESECNTWGLRNVTVYVLD